MKTLMTLIVVLLVATPLIGQTSVPKKDGKAKHYFQALTNKEMTEYKEYLSQFPDSVNLSELTMGDLRIVMAYTHTAAVREARDIARQEIHQRAVELPAKTDTTIWRSYGLEPGKKYKGLLVTRIDSVRRAEEEARYAVEDELTNVSETVGEVVAVVTKDETLVAVSPTKTIPAHEAAMERLKARRRAAIAAAAGK